VEHLEQMYIDFETMQREVVIWLDNAEDVLQELDQLKEDAELSDRHVNKFKVQYIFALFRYAALQQSVASYGLHYTNYGKSNLDTF